MLHSKKHCHIHDTSLELSRVLFAQEKYLRFHSHPEAREATMVCGGSILAIFDGLRSSLQNCLSFTKHYTWTGDLPTASYVLCSLQGLGQGLQVAFGIIGSHINCLEKFFCNMWLERVRTQHVKSWKGAVCTSAHIQDPALAE